MEKTKQYVKYMLCKYDSEQNMKWMCDICIVCDMRYSLLGQTEIRARRFSICMKMKAITILLEGKCRMSQSENQPK